MENLISVIVLTYNEEKTIARTLDSVLGQICHVPIEIVIGEDCSTDGTRAVCEEYAAKYPDKIRLMDKAPNKGVIDNYFDCMLACKGKYIADCAGDDFWVSPYKLEKEVSILEKNPNVTLVHTDWVFYNEVSGKKIAPKATDFDSPVTDGKDMLEAIVTQTERFVIHLCTALYRTEILKKEYFKNEFLFRNKAFGCEDLQVCFVMALNGSIAYVPEVTLCYSCGKPSASAQSSFEKQFHFIKLVTDLSFYICSEYGLKSKKTDIFFQKRLFAQTMQAFRGYDKQLVAEAKECGRNWNVQETWNTRLVNAIMSNAFSWKIALGLRKIFIALKGLKRFV